MKVRALKPITYASKRYSKGDVFEASDFYARPLIILGKIVRETEEAEARETLGLMAAPSRRSRKSDDPDRPRRQYRRRDMQADS